MLTKMKVVSFDQIRLADRRHRLQVGDVFGAVLQAQLAHSRANSPGADQHDLPPLVEKSVDLPRQTLDASSIKRTIFAREHPRAHFHDDSSR